MRYRLTPFAVVAATIGLFSPAAAQQPKAIDRTADATPSSKLDTAGIHYGVAHWSENGFGNHRAVVQVREKSDAVFARLPWRRQDPEPEKKGVVVFDSKGQQVLNVVRGKIDRESGEIAFQPASGPGEYFIYFMPNGKLASLKSTAEVNWLNANRLATGELAKHAESLPAAKLLRFESKSEFDRRDPMELIATARETADLVARHPKSDYLVFPEDRRFGARMFNDLPYRWIRKGTSDRFSGEAAPNEYFTFQLGVYASRQAIADIRIEASDLTGPGDAVLAAKSVHCINAGGTDWVGKTFVKPIAIGMHTVKALWFVVDVPENAVRGKYQGKVTLRPVAKGGGELAATQVALDITVGGDPVAFHGCLDAWRMSRLGWLNSTIGEEDTVIAPYTPVELHDNTAKMLNRSITFNVLGLPEHITAGGNELLAGAVAFTVEGEKGSLAFSHGKRVLAEMKKSLVTSTWEHRSDALRMNVQATVEFDGCLDYRIKLRAEKDTDTKDVSLDIPMRSEIAQYFMGLGKRGGFAPEQVKWKWDVNRVTNKLWAGNGDGGLIVDLMHNQDLWPNAFNYRNWGTPQSWDNRGKGGCDFTHDAKTTRIHAYTGPHTWKAGDEVEFHIHLLVTPFKPIDMKQFRYRYSGKDPRHAQEGPGAPKVGCNIAHTHHAMDGINPWINYPFLTIDGMKAYLTRLRGYGYQDMDVYYTLREISNHMTEIWALRSLDDEIFSANESITYDERGGRVFKGGGGYSWLQEHLLTGYAPAWTVGVEGSVDAAIATQGVSRLHNSYVEGLDLLMRQVGFKGLYLDGIGYNRQTMKRIARVMAKNTPDYRIKVHTGNNFDYAGWHCNAMLHYGEHLPYVTDLYIGEGYSYNAAPDYWFVEMSGIPFGLTNEMLGGGSNPWRGMLYGMDCRENGVSSGGLWKLWDSFGIEQSQMIGYWDPRCPVKSGNKDVHATVYRKPGKSLVAIGSWAKEPVQCRLNIDWKALGLDPKKAHLFAPSLKGFQTSALFEPTEEIPVPPGRGYLFILDEEKHEAVAVRSSNAYEGRKVLLEDRFDRDELGKEWKSSVSKQRGTSLKLAKNSLAIEAPDNCFCFAERALPASCTLVECQVFSGTDRGASWGPGLALVWKKKILRINLRGEGRFGVDDGGQNMDGVVAPNTWYHVRLRIEPAEVLAEASRDGKMWYPIHVMPRSAFEGDPAAVRLGKMNSSGQAQDFATPGPVHTCTIKDLRIYGTK